MLVLSRKIGETIRIGTDIDVMVLGVSHGRVKLGFSAPQEVAVRRSEVLEKAPLKGYVESRPSSMATVAH